jgi:hypothetical protein
MASDGGAVVVSPEEQEHDDLVEALDLMYSPQLERCARCGKHGRRARLLACSRCHGIAYCDAQCQKQHWATHKDACALSAALRLPSTTLLPEFRFPSHATRTVITAKWLDDDEVAKQQPAISAYDESAQRIEFQLKPMMPSAVPEGGDDEEEGTEKSGDDLARLQKVIANKAAQAPAMSVPLVTSTEELASSLVGADDVVFADSPSSSVRMTFVVPLGAGPTTFECRRSGGGGFTRADAVACVQAIYRVLFAAGPLFGVSVHAFADLSLHSAVCTQPPNGWTIIVDT